MEPDEVERALKAAFPLAKQVEAALQGAVYPLTRRQVVLVARANEAPKTLVSLLEGMPDGRFGSLDDVQVAVSPPPAPAPGAAPPSPAPERSVTPERPAPR